MKTSGVSWETKFGLLVVLGHPTVQGLSMCGTGWYLVVLGQYRGVLVDTWWYWVSIGRYWLTLGGTGSVCQKVVLQLVTTIRATQIVPIWPIQPSAVNRIFALQSLIWSCNWMIMINTESERQFAIQRAFDLTINQLKWYQKADDKFFQAASNNNINISSLSHINQVSEKGFYSKWAREWSKCR